MHLNPNVQVHVNRLLGGLPTSGSSLRRGTGTSSPCSPRSRLVLTDSGGVQEEAPSLGKPVLVMRDTTERPEGVAAGTAILTGPKASEIASHATRLLTDPGAYAAMAQARNPYGDGQAAGRIVAAIRGYFGGAGPRS